jgi:hypothetical protein
VSARTRLAALIALAIITPLLIWAAPPASAAATVDLASPYGRDVWPGKKPSDLAVYDSGRGDAVATFRNTNGTVVRTMSTPAMCFFDNCFDPESFSDHEVEWDGKNNSGVVVPAGRYTGNLRFVDENGQPQNVSLGNLWVNRLVTRTAGGWQETWIDHSLDSLSTVGRCSAVLGSTPGQPWQVRLLSMNRCNSSAGTDDWAFRAQRLNFFEDDHVSRIISVRIGATGSPVHAGDVASIVVDSSAGTAPSPTWRRVAELGKAGTHLGKAFTPPRGSMNGPRYNLLIQGRVVNGNRWRVNNYEASWTYRAFTR